MTRSQQAYDAFRRLDTDGDLRLSAAERASLPPDQAERLAQQVAASEGNALHRLLATPQVNMIAGSTAISQLGPADWFTAVSETTMTGWMTAKSDVSLAHWFAVERGEWYGKAVENLMDGHTRSLVARCEVRNKWAPSLFETVILTERHTPCQWKEGTLVALLSVAEYFRQSGDYAEYGLEALWSSVISDYRGFNLPSAPLKMDKDQLLTQHPEITRYSAGDLDWVIVALQAHWTGLDYEESFNLVVKAIAHEGDSSKMVSGLMGLIGALENVDAFVPFYLDQIITRNTVPLGQYAQEITALATLLKQQKDYNLDVNGVVWHQIIDDTVKQFHNDFESTLNRLPSSMRYLVGDVRKLNDIQALNTIADGIEANNGLTWPMIDGARRHNLTAPLIAAALQHLHFIPTPSGRLHWITQEVRAAKRRNHMRRNGHPWNESIATWSDHYRLGKALAQFGTHWPTAAAQRSKSQDLPEFLALLTKEGHRLDDASVSPEAFERVCTAAHDNLGIRHYGWYSFDTLTRAVSDHQDAQAQPRALYVASRYDWNNSLRGNVNNNLQALWQAGYHVDLMEGHSSRQLLRAIRALPTHDYKQVVLEAHANSFVMNIGEKNSSDVDWYDRPFWQGVADRLAYGGTLYLAGCYTGGKNQWSRHESLVRYVAQHHRFAQNVVVAGPACESSTILSARDTGLEATAQCPLNEVFGWSPRRPKIVTAQLTAP